MTTENTTTTAVTKPTAAYGDRGLVIRDFGEMQRVAMAFIASGYFKDTRDVAQACVKIQLGAELGLPPVSAMQAIHVIEGKAALSASLVAARIKNSGRYRYKTIAWDDQQCVLEFYEKQDGEWLECGQASFTIKDAMHAGIAERGTWKKYPKSMLFARAVTQGARAYCADVFHGSPVYTEDELMREPREAPRRQNEQRPDIEYDANEEAQRPTPTSWLRRRGAETIDAGNDE